MHQALRRIGALRFAIIYIILASVVGVLLDWRVFHVAPKAYFEELQFLDEALLISITTVALFFLLRALISEQRYEQTQHRETQLAYEQLFRAHTHPMWLIDKGTREILDVNDAAVSRYGWSQQEFLGMKADDLQYPQKMGETDAHFRSFLDESASHQAAKRHRDRSGNPFWVEITTHQVNFSNRPMLLVTGVDISVQVEAARSARKALKHLEDAEKLGRFGAWEWHPGSSYMNISRGLARLLDVPYDKTEIPIQVAIDQLIPEDREISKAAVEKCLETGAAEATFRGKLPNGEIRYYREIFHRQAYNGQEYVLTGSIIDETDQRRYTRQLEQQQSDLRTILTNLPAPVVLHQPGNDGHLVMANPAFYCMLGVPAGEEHSIASLEDVGAGPEHKQLLKELINNTAPQSVTSRKQEVLLRRHNGSVFRVHVHCTRVNLADRTLIQLVIHDIDDEILLREQLRQANSNLSKLNSKTLKVLEQERALISRELHDDIGQLLIAVKTNTRSLFRKWPSREPKPGEVELISDILEELVAKVRDRSLMLRPPQLDELGLKHAISWELRRVLGSSDIDSHFKDRVSVEKLPAEPSLTAFRIFQEAMTNAVRHADPEQINVTLETDSEHLLIRIEDDGNGFDVDENQNGLGLANMRERANLVAGALRVQSRPGVGTRIEARLPLTGTHLVSH